jgi:hypothetical protein
MVATTPQLRSESKTGDGAVEEIKEAASGEYDGSRTSVSAAINDGSSMSVSATTDDGVMVSVSATTNDGVMASVSAATKNGSQASVSVPAADGDRMSASIDTNVDGTPSAELSDPTVDRVSVALSGDPEQTRSEAVAREIIGAMVDAELTRMAPAHTGGNPMPGSGRESDDVTPATLRAALTAESTRRDQAAAKVMQVKVRQASLDAAEAAEAARREHTRQKRKEHTKARRARRAQQELPDRGKEDTVTREKESSPAGETADDVMFRERARQLPSLDTLRASFSEVDVRLEHRLIFEYAKVKAKSQAPPSLTRPPGPVFHPPPSYVSLHRGGAMAAAAPDQRLNSAADPVAPRPIVRKREATYYSVAGSRSALDLGDQKRPRRLGSLAGGVPQTPMSSQSGGTLATSPDTGYGPGVNDALEYVPHESGDSPARRATPAAPVPTQDEEPVRRHEMDQMTESLSDMRREVERHGRMLERAGADYDANVNEIRDLLERLDWYETPDSSLQRLQRLEQGLARLEGQLDLLLRLQKGLWLRHFGRQPLGPLLLRVPVRLEQANVKHGVCTHLLRKIERIR